MSASNASQHKKKCGSCYGQPEEECDTNTAKDVLYIHKIIFIKNYT
jgi:hypothetical protein